MGVYLWKITEYGPEGDIDCEYLVAGDDQATSLRMYGHTEVTIIDAEVQ